MNGKQIAPPEKCTWWDGLYYNGSSLKYISVYFSEFNADVQFERIGRNSESTPPWSDQGVVM